MDPGIKKNLLRGLDKDKIALSSCLILAVLLFLAIFAPLISPHDPYDLETLDIMNSQIPPVWYEEGSDPRFLFGTDAQGRDLLSTVFYGMRVSLLIGFGAVGLQALLGILIGLVAGYSGGKIDVFLMRFSDIQLSFSMMMVAIIFMTLIQAVFGSDFYSKYAAIALILIIGFAEWPKFARTVRSSVLAEKKKEYVEAARVMNFGKLRIMFLHVLPNCLSSVLVIATVQIAEAIISEAALSFLGLGMPVNEPSLGALISSGFEYVFSGDWWITFIPGIFLFLLVLSVNLLGDHLRDYFNPKIR